MEFLLLILSTPVRRRTCGLVVLELVLFSVGGIMFLELSERQTFAQCDVLYKYGSLYSSWCLFLYRFRYQRKYHCAGIQNLKFLWRPVLVFFWKIFQGSFNWGKKCFWKLIIKPGIPDRVRQCVSLWDFKIDMTLGSRLGKVCVHTLCCATGFLSVPKNNQ